MRTATIVLVAYVLCVVVTSLWRYMPGFVHDAIPALGALTAAYLGHTTRPYRVPATAGAVVLGYLQDVISGTPPGMSSPRARPPATRTWPGKRCCCSRRATACATRRSRCASASARTSSGTSAPPA